MITRRQWRRFIDHPVVEWAMFTLGVLLLIAALIVGPLPGPGGVIFAVPGLILVRMLPPLVVKDEDIAEAIARLDRACARIEQAALEKSKTQRAAG